MLGMESKNLARQRVKRNRSKPDEASSFDENPREALVSGGSRVDLIDRLINELETDQIDVRVRQPAPNPFKKQKVDNPAPTKDPLVLSMMQASQRNQSVKVKNQPTGKQLLTGKKR